MAAQTNRKLSLRESSLRSKLEWLRNAVGDIGLSKFLSGKLGSGRLGGMYVSGLLQVGFESPAIEQLVDLLRAGKTVRLVDVDKYYGRMKYPVGMRIRDKQLIDVWLDRA